MNFASKLPFARDRLVEGYIWSVGVYFEPKYSLARVIMTKVTGVTTMIDDIYDVYGTLEELELFADAVERYLVISLTYIVITMACFFFFLDSSQF